jgi:RHS repeat-associated protein
MGDDIYGDYSVGGSATNPLVTDTLSHVPGLGQSCGTGVPACASGEARYLHGNLIGTNETASGPSGALAGRAVYTAFGGPVCGAGGVSGCGAGNQPVDSRYGYAGAWGYQSGDWDNEGGTCDSGNPSQSCDPLASLGWLHVGARYYDHASGRFVQRDPIGIRGGLNTYAYISNLPTSRLDPLGLQATMFWNAPVNPFTAEPLPGHPRYHGPEPRPWVPPHKLIQHAESQRGKNGNDSDHHAAGVREVGRCVGMMSGPFYYPVGAVASTVSAIGLTIGEVLFPSSDWKDDIKENWRGVLDFLEKPPSG